MYSTYSQVLHILPPLKDLVLAAKFLSGEERKRLILGLAYNTAEIWDWEHGCILKSFVCPSDPCMLFAMDFSGRVEEGMAVASGTAFNQVYAKDNWFAFIFASLILMTFPYQSLLSYYCIYLHRYLYEHYINTYHLYTYIQKARLTLSFRPHSWLYGGCRGGKPRFWEGRRGWFSGFVGYVKGKA